MLLVAQMLFKYLVTSSNGEQSIIKHSANENNTYCDCVSETLIKHIVALCRYDNSQNLIFYIVVKSSELLTKSNSCTSLHATLNENV